MLFVIQAVRLLRFEGFDIPESMRVSLVLLLLPGWAFWLAELLLLLLLVCWSGCMGG